MDLSLKEHFEKVGYETQRMDLSLKEYFKKWDTKLKGWIWASKHILKNGLWNLKSGFEFQRTFLKMGYETQTWDMSLKEHF